MSNRDTKRLLNNFKMEVASELGVDLKNPKITAQDAGRVGGEMVKRMVTTYENNNNKAK